MKRRPAAWKIVTRILLGGVAAVVLWSAVLAWQIAAYGGRHDPAPADVAIVLGAAVWDADPSPVFAARIDHAVALYRGGRVRRIVFTGGVGAGERHAEAEVARRYAVRAGVPGRHIAVETRSTITYENLREARALLGSGAAPRVLIVSDPLHLRRAVTMARDLGLDAHPAPTPHEPLPVLAQQGRLPGPRGLLLFPVSFRPPFPLREGTVSTPPPSPAFP